LCCGLVDEEKYRHTDGKAIGYLLEYNAVLTVSYFAFHL
jgi:hypothetical protein